MPYVQNGTIWNDGNKRIKTNIKKQFREGINEK